ncbi:hypothetical protein [Stenotrophomonas sp.]|uniref:hypothetical protein n=1 Tax=Stenotrophomonas sp. TaxID=69392 RepID=UPI0028AB44BE|nr:hypothetical protein [Stenotrophomonas sp.]
MRLPDSASAPINNSPSGSGNQVPTPAFAPALPLSSIEQKELSYFRDLGRRDQEIISQRFPSCTTRLRALGAQLEDIRNAGFGSRCRVGDVSLDALFVQGTDELARGSALLQALPEVASPMAGWAYAVLLRNASVPGDDEGRATLGAAAAWITLVTVPEDVQR